jgi:carbamoyl-phosphate synthase small subunit
MTGYQEILTDPSYRGQIVVMTLPHVGNYGMSLEASESRRPWVEGFVARRFTRRASSHGSEEDLPDYLRGHSVPALDGIDTRAVVRRIRARGALRGVITSERSDTVRLLEEIVDHPEMAGRALVTEVTCDEPYTVPAVRGSGAGPHLAVFDFGVKGNILRLLAGRGARLTVVPAHTKPSEIESMAVDGIVLSNGPGDPEPLREIIGTIGDLIAGGVPILGICLGHQLLALALGGKTMKLKFGHHGGNQPVIDRQTGRVLITSQNHGFAVESNSLPDGCVASQVNLNDGTVEAFSVAGRPILSAQYHPEAAPGPHDAEDLFDRFLDLVAARKTASK